MTAHVDISAPAHAGSLSAINTRRGGRKKLTIDTASVGAQTMPQSRVRPALCPLPAPSVTVRKVPRPERQLTDRTLPVYTVESDSDDDDNISNVQASASSNTPQAATLHSPRGAEINSPSLSDIPECAFIGESATLSPASSIVPASSDSPVLSPPISASPGSSILWSTPPASPPASPAPSLRPLAQVVPTLWNEPVRTSSDSMHGTSISTALAHRALPSNRGAAPPAPRGTITAPPDLPPPPYSTSELNTIPLPSTNQSFAPPALHPHSVSALQREGNILSWFSSTLLPARRDWVAMQRAVDRLCTPELRVYLHELDADPFIFEIVHKCMMSYPNYGSKHWKAILARSGFTDAQVKDIVMMFPRRPRGLNI